MNYPFPLITNIEQVRKAVAGREEFKEVDKGDHIIFNYLVNFADTFPNPWEKYNFPLDGEKEVLNTNSTLLRECRGLVFDKETGRVISRRYHKFFNLNEKPETAHEKLDFTKPHVILEKLDGSMIAPYITSDGELYIGTKMGDTDVAKNAADFISRNDNISEFIEACLRGDETPIFEWCSRRNRIVVDYPDDMLILTAVRDNITGKYLKYSVIKELSKIWQIQCVKAIESTSDDILSSLSTLEDAEGYVIRFDDGHMIKVKGDWYVQLHRLLDSVKNEKDIIPLILNDKLDDAKAFFPDDLAIKLDRFGEKMMQNIFVFADSVLFSTRLLFASQYSDKEFAEAIKESPIKSLFFSIKKHVNKNGYSGKDELREIIFNIVKDNIIKSCSTKAKVEEIRHIIKVKWDD